MIHPLNYLELHLDFLLKTGLYHKKKTIKADVNILRVRPDRVQPAFFSLLYL